LPVRKSRDSGQIASTPCCLDPLLENNDWICDMLMQASQIVGKIYEILLATILVCLDGIAPSSGV
jgi:hypothetical protein